MPTTLAITERLANCDLALRACQIEIARLAVRFGADVFDRATERMVNIAVRDTTLILTDDPPQSVNACRLAALCRKEEVLSRIYTPITQITMNMETVRDRPIARIESSLNYVHGQIAKVLVSP